MGRAVNLSTACFHKTFMLQNCFLCTNLHWTLGTKSCISTQLILSCPLFIYQKLPGEYGLLQGKNSTTPQKKQDFLVSQHCGPPISSAKRSKSPLHVWCNNRKSLSRWVCKQQSCTTLLAWTIPKKSAGCTCNGDTPGVIAALPRLLSEITINCTTNKVISLLQV